MKNFQTDPGALNTPWVFSPFFETLLESVCSDSRERELARHYREHGYAVLDFPVAEPATLQRAIEDLVGRYDTPATGYETLSTKLDAWQFSEAVSEIALASAVLEALELLYGRRPIPFQTLSFELGSQQRAHSDTIHFHSVPQRFMAGVWVALEDIHPDSGPLQVFPGSHRLPVLDMLDLRLESGWESYLEYEDAIAAILDAEGIGPRRLVPERGQAVIWSANLMHGGAPVEDESRKRHNQVTHYYFEDCLYYQPAPSDPFMGRMVLKEVVEIGSGRIVPNLYRGRPVEEWLPAQG